MRNLEIRAATAGDIAAIAKLSEAVALFPGEMTVDMIAPFLGGEECADIWLVAECEGAVCSFTFCEPERMTEGTANMLALAVDPALQGSGIGAEVTFRLETILAQRGDRLLLAETSGLPEFAQTRQFYRKQGYEEEGRIRDFYAAGDDKIIFRKALG